MKKIVLLFLILLLTQNGFSCVNEATTILLNGEGVEEVGNYVPAGTDFYVQNDRYEDNKDTLLKLWNQTHDPVYYSDYGVALIYLGRYEEAKKVFIAIEKEFPGLYNTAANLGTAYELLGKNDSALIWIKKAVEINPDSHDKSEWIHVKILEAKIGGEKFINSTFLIGTSFGDGEDPVSKLSEVELNELRNAIFYQLDERISFIKPKEKIVALLLFELGNLCVLTTDLSNALENYKLAKSYGYESKVMDKRMDKYQKMLEKFSQERRAKKEKKSSGSSLSSNSNLLVILISSVTVFLAAIAFYFWYKRRKK